MIFQNPQAQGSQPAVTSAEDILFSDVKNNDIELVKDALSAGASANICGANGTTLLMAAAQLGLQEMVTLLIEAGADINATDNQGSTALMLAAAGGHLRLCNTLMWKGANINAQNNAGHTAGALAHLNGHVALARRLGYSTQEPEGEQTPDNVIRLGYSAPEPKGEQTPDNAVQGTGAQTTPETPSANATPNNTQNLDIALLSALQKSHWDEARLLLEQGADTSATTATGASTPLILAAFRGHEDMVRRLIAAGADVNACNAKGMTALMVAANGGHLAVIHMLLENHADPYKKNLRGETALMIAKRMGQQPAVLALQEATQSEQKTQTAGGLTAGGQSSQGSAPEGDAQQNVVSQDIPHLDVALLSALQALQWDEANRLLDQGASVNAITSTSASTPLMLAASGGNEDMVRRLIAAGADVNASNAKGMTALMMAANSGHYAVASVLLENHADPDKISAKGETALMIATRMGSQLFVNVLQGKAPHTLLQAVQEGLLLEVRRLLSKGANPNDSEDGLLPLPCAIQGKSFGIIRLLVEAGADVNAVHNGATPLHMAAAENRTDIVRLLLEAGANVDAQNADGLTALALAAGNGNAALLGLLLRAGANTEVQSANGRTALLQALHAARDNATATSWHMSVARLLLAQGANANACGHDGQSALALAAAKRDPITVRRLIAAGAQVNTKDSRGYTPLMIAAQNGTGDIVKVLLEKGADAAAANAQGQTAHMLAQAAGHTAVALELQQRQEAQRGVLGMAKRLLTPFIGASANQDENAQTETAQAELGETLLRAADAGDDEGVLACLKQGANANITDEYGRTPLLHAAHKMRVQALQTLLRAGADVNVADVNGWTALMNICYKSHPKQREACVGLAKTLVRAGADVNAANKDGYTALMNAAGRGGHEEIVQLLLEYGANPLATTKAPLSKTALTLARENGNDTIARLLHKEMTFLQSRAAKQTPAQPAPGSGNDAAASSPVPAPAPQQVRAAAPMPQGAQEKPVRPPLPAGSDLANAAQHEPLRQWFETQGVQVQFDYSKISNILFARGALAIGENEPLMRPFLERVKTAYKNGRPGFKFSLDKYAEAEAETINKISYLLYKSTLLANSYYREQPEQQPRRFLNIGLQNDNHDVRVFLQGVWLEWFALGMLLRHWQPGFSVARSFQLVFQDGHFNEIDAALLPPGKPPILIECKAGSNFSDVLNKMNSIKNIIGLPDGRFVLVASQYSNEEIAALNDMHRSIGIQFANLQSLGACISALL